MCRGTHSAGHGWGHLSSSSIIYLGGEGLLIRLGRTRGIANQAPSVLRFEKGGTQGRGWSHQEKGGALGMLHAGWGSPALLAPFLGLPPALQPVRADEPHLRHPQRGFHHHLHPGDGAQAHGVQSQGESGATGPMSWLGPTGRGPSHGAPPPQPRSPEGPHPACLLPTCSPLWPHLPSDTGWAR